MLRHSLVVSTLLCVAYGGVFVCAITGNVFLLYVLYKSPTIRTTTNIYIGNLAVADLLVTVFCIPFTLTANLLNNWPFGGIICKFIAYVQAVAVNASANSLVAISINKCLIINRPFIHTIKKKVMLISLAIIWLFPLLFMCPWLIKFSVKPFYDENGIINQICADFWESKLVSDIYFIVANLVLNYLFPLIIISICYIIIYKKIHTRNIPGELCPERRRLLHYSSRIKIIKMIFVIIITFFLSWLPLYLLFIFSKFFYQPSKDDYLQIIFPIAQWLATSNTCINPIIYGCYSRKLRIKFKKLVKTIPFTKRYPSTPSVFVFANFNNFPVISSTEITTLQI